MRIFGIDPGSKNTGYGCIDTEDGRFRFVVCGAVTVSPRLPFSERLAGIYDGLTSLLAKYQPACVAIENVFYARNVSSALKLGHARGVAMLAAAKAGLTVTEYAPTEVKRAVVGYGRADKTQVREMVMLLLGLDTTPSPDDASDALAIAVCHANSAGGPPETRVVSSGPRSWRQYRPRDRRP